MVRFRQVVLPLAVTCTALVGIAVAFLSISRPVGLRAQPSTRDSVSVPRAPLDSQAVHPFCPGATSRPTWETLPFDCPPAGSPRLSSEGLIRMTTGCFSQKEPKVWCPICFPAESFCKPLSSGES